MSCVEMGGDVVVDLEEGEGSFVRWPNLWHMCSFEELVRAWC